MSYISFHYWALQVKKIKLWTRFFTVISRSYQLSQFKNQILLIRKKDQNNECDAWIVFLIDLAGPVPERSQGPGVQQPGRRAAQDPGGVHPGERVPDRREPVQVAGPGRAVQHDRHLPPPLLRDDQDQRGRDPLGARLHRAAAGAEPAAAQGGAGRPVAVAPRVRGGRGQPAGRSPLKQRRAGNLKNAGGIKMLKAETKLNRTAIRMRVDIVATA
jgi:hypothetical protein